MAAHDVLSTGNSTQLTSCRGQKIQDGAKACRRKGLFKAPPRGGWGVDDVAVGWAADVAVGWAADVAVGGLGC